GYRVLTASDGIEARKVLEGDAAIDLLLTDVIMPNGVSGIDLAQSARRTRRDLKVVLVSGYARDVKARTENLSKDWLFLDKPFRQAELAAVVASALKAR